ncbi:putative Phage tail tape measure protein [Ruminococcaceae bacterium BL-4]|nr:putative Phage tail tape measure protein [Ruminococcaceae bacterium BL-4]
MAIDLGVAEGHIDLDFSNLQKGVASTVGQLQQLERTGNLTESQLRLMETATKGVGGVFNDAAQKSKRLSAEIEIAKQKAEAYKTGISGLNEIIKKSQTEYDKTGKKVDELSKKYEASKTKVQDVANAHGKESEEYQKAEKASKELNNQLLQEQSRHASLGLEINGSKAKINEYAAAMNNTQADIQNMGRELSIAESKMHAFGVAAEGVGSKMQSIGGKMSKIGGTLSLAVTAPLVAAGTASYKWAESAETSYAKVSTIADSTKLSYDQLKTGITNASNQTGVAVTDLNEALYQSISAGVDSGKAIGFTTDMVKLARGGFTDTAKAVDVVTSVLNAYGLSADNASSISDKLITTQNIGKTTVDQLASSLGRVIPAAKENKVSIDEVCTSMAVMTKHGIKTEEATTYLTSMLKELGKSGTVADQALRKMSGKGFSDLMASGKSVTNVLQILQDYASKSGKQLSDMFGSVEAGSAAFSLMSDGGKEYNEVLQQMTSSAGAAQSAADKIDATPAVKMQKELSKIKNEGIEIGEKLIPYAEKGMSAISGLVDKFDKLSDSQKDTILQGLGIVAAGGPVLKIFGKLTSGIGKVISNVGGLTQALSTAKSAHISLSAAAETLSDKNAGLAKALGSVVSPAGLTVAAITAVGVAAYAAYQKQEEAHNKFMAECDALSQKIAKETESWEKLSISTQANVSANNTESDNLRSLESELDNLVDANGRVKSGQEDRVNYILNELNGALGTNISVEDGVIQEYTKEKQSLEELIQAQRNKANLDAYQSKYTTALQGIADARKDATEAQDKLNSATDKYNGLIKEQSDLGAKGGKGLDASLTKRITDARTEMEAAQKTVGETSSVVGKYQQTIENYNDAVGASAEKNYNLSNTFLNRLTLSYTAAGNATKEQLEDQVNSTESSFEDLKQRYADGDNTVTQQMVSDAQDLANKAKAEYRKAGGDAAEGAALGFDDVKSTLKSLGIEISDAAVTAISKMGADDQSAAIDACMQLAAGAEMTAPAVKKAAKSLGIDMSDELSESLASASPDVRQNAIDLMMQLQSASEDQRPGIISALNNLGFDVDQALSSGMTDNAGNVSGAAGDTAEGAKNALTGAGLEDTANTVGSNTGANLAGGISGQSGNASGSASGIANDVQTALVNAGLEGTANTVGSGTGSNLAGGISGKSGDVSGSANTLAGTAAQIFTNYGLEALASTIGAGTGSNLAGGLSGQQEGVSDASQGLADNAQTPLSGLQDLSSAWGSDMASNFASGISGMWDTVSKAAGSLANAVKGLLHFSRPDYGPMRDYEQWPVDFVNRYAELLKQSSPAIEKQSRAIAERMRDAMVVNPTIDTSTWESVNDVLQGQKLPLKQVLKVQYDKDNANTYKQAITDGILSLKKELTASLMSAAPDVTINNNGNQQMDAAAAAAAFHRQQIKAAHGL